VSSTRSLARVDGPDPSDDEIIERVGLPASPTGHGVACDPVALAAGERTTLLWTAHLSQEVVDRRLALVLSHLPLGIGPDTVIATIAARVQAMNSNDPEWYPDHVWGHAAVAAHFARSDRDSTCRHPR
jgi:hypothetical protein